MTDPSIPLVNRGAEALAALLNYDEIRAANNIRQLTFTELVYLAIAADELARLARAVRHETWPAPSGRLQTLADDAEREDAARRLAASPVTVHRGPPDGNGVMPCCGKTPFELPGDRMAFDDKHVTCRGSQAPATVQAQNGAP